MRILFLGDSIMQFNDCLSFPQTGWVQMLDRFFVRGTEFLNFARNGRSSKSFIAEGRLEKALENCFRGDFVLIQFAHNDEKINDKTRFSSCEKGGEFRKNLALMAQKFLERGAKPIFLTPVVRRLFDAQGKIENSHGGYQEAVLETARELRVPCIDLTDLTRGFFEKLGEEKSKPYFMNFPAGLYENFPDGKTDNSHLTPLGAFSVCGLFCTALAEFDFAAFDGYYEIQKNLALGGAWTDEDIDDEKSMWN